MRRTMAGKCGIPGFVLVVNDSRMRWSILEGVTPMVVEFFLGRPEMQRIRTKMGTRPEGGVFVFARTRWDVSQSQHVAVHIPICPDSSGNENLILLPMSHDLSNLRNLWIASSKTF